MRIQTFFLGLLLCASIPYSVLANSGTNYVNYNRGINVITNSIKFTDANTTNSGIEFADGSFIFTSTNLITGTTTNNQIILDKQLVTPSQIITNDLVVSNSVTVGNINITNNVDVSKNLTVTNNTTTGNLSVTNSIGVTNKIVFTSSNPTNSGILFADGTFEHSASSRVIVAIQPLITTTNASFGLSEFVTVYKWIPVTPNTNSMLVPSFTGPSTGYAAMSEIYFANTNRNPVFWPTNITEFVVNGLSQAYTNAPSLGIYNIMVAKWWDSKLSIWIINTNTYVR
jgi:hypothetical protein